MNFWTLEAICPLMQEAGKIAMRHYLNPETEFKSDLSVVTAADKEVEEFLTGKLAGDDSYIIGEETFEKYSEDYLHSALKETAWIIDPIDGTALYANKMAGWGVSVGFAQKGKIEEGAIFLPDNNIFLISCHGKVYYAETSDNVLEWDLLNQIKLLDNFNPAPLTSASLVTVSQRIVKYGGYSGPQNVQSFCSCVYPAAALCQRKSSGAVMRAKLWDFAGFISILRNLGYFSSDPTGKDYLKGEISDDYYDLSKDCPVPFLMKGFMVIGNSKQDVDFLINSTTFSLRWSK